MDIVSRNIGYFIKIVIPAKAGIQFFVLDIRCLNINFVFFVILMVFNCHSERSEESPAYAGLIINLHSQEIFHFVLDDNKRDDFVVQNIYYILDDRPKCKMPIFHIFSRLIFELVLGSIFVSICGPAYRQAGLRTCFRQTHFALIIS